MRLAVRLTLVFGLLGLITVAGVSTVAWWLAANESRETVDAALLQRITPVQRIIGSADGAAELGADGPRIDRDVSDVDPAELPFLGDPELFNARGDVTQVGIVLEDGSTVGSPPVEPTEASLASLDNPELFYESVTVDGTPFRVLTLPVEGRSEPLTYDQSVVGVQLARDVTNETDALSNLALQLALLSTVGVLAVIAASWLVGRWLTKPINQLTTTAEHLAELDDLPGRVEVRRNDEIGRLAASYNRLMSALEVGREQQRRLVADASHELRTPLTSLRMRVEYLAHDDPGTARRQQILGAAVADAEQLSALVSDLVDLAADARSAEEEPELVDLSALAAEVAAQAHNSTGRAIDVDADGTVAQIRPTMVRRALRNLVDNALKYGSADGRIAIHVRNGALEVHDDGPGIAAEDAALVFDRFYRSPKARSRPGNGIGLAIVKQVADAHGGSVWVDAVPGGGAIVGFSVIADAVDGAHPEAALDAAAAPAITDAQLPTG
ncbi:MAG: HAMP domain-containing sensor histidine kinase [Actinomycetota bacterium]